LLTDNADNDLKEHQEEEGILEPFLSKSSRSSVMDANIADSLDREDSLSDQEQSQAATSISEAYGLLTPSVKVRAHFKIFHHWKILPTCNSMKHSEAYG
jgi:hypothetical protein